MNDLVKDTLERRAAGAEPRPVDPDAIMAVGRQRVRRRRVAGGVGALAAVAVLGVAAPFVLGGAGDDGPQVARDPGTFAGEVSWGNGSQVRVGDRTIDVGVPVEAYVLTVDGVVAVDDTGAVLFADGVGEPVRIGSLGVDAESLLAGDGSWLVADRSYVAWLDRGTGEFVVYDTKTGREVRRVWPEGGFPAVVALDGNALWTFTEGQMTAIDLATGEVIDGFPAVDAGVLSSVEGSVQVRVDGRQAVVQSSDGNVLSRVPSGRSDLSPEATYVVTDANDSEQVYDVATGDEVTPDFGDYTFQAVVQWLSDDTYQAIALNPDDRGNVEGGVDFLVCSVAAGTCDVAARDVVELGPGLSVPVGESFGD